MAQKELNMAAVHGGDGEAGGTADWQQAVDYVKENPKTVIASVLFVLICAVLGGFYSLYAAVQDRHAMSVYADALNEKDPTAKMDALQAVAAAGNRWSVEALYLAGEAAIEAKAYDKARETFQKVVNDHKDSPYTPQAAEGLAFLDENDGKLEEALAGYTKVFETWDSTFTGRRQPLNMGRLQEELGKLPEAIASYKKQTEIFPESSVAGSAEQALSRLKSEHPDLFPEEKPAAETAPAGGATSAVSVAPAAEAAPAPAPEAAPAPAAEAAPAPAAETAPAPAPEAAPAAPAAPAAQ